MNKYLPFEYSPLFKSSQYLAFYFGILQANISNILPWIYCNFVACSTECFYFGSNIWEYNRDIIAREPCYEISPEISKDTLVEMVKNNLLSNRYVNGIFDEFYIPSKSAYLSRHKYHDYILTGFDDDKQAFVSAGYISKGVYKKFEIAYDDYYNSTVGSYNPKDKNAIVNAISVNNEVNYKFELLDFCDGIYDFIKQPIFLYVEPINGCHGLCSWKYLYKHLLLVSERKENLDLRICRFITEHRSLLSHSITYLSSEVIINPSLSKLADEYKNLSKEIGVMFNLCIKHYMSASETSMKNLLSKVEYFYHNECRILSDLITNLLEISTKKLL